MNADQSEGEREIRRLFDEEKVSEMLEYIEVYATSVESPDENDKKSKKARELYQYLSNNWDGLLPYDKQGKEMQCRRHQEKHLRKLLVKGANGVRI